jgi:hypothetical protein
MAACCPLTPGLHDGNDASQNCSQGLDRFLRLGPGRSIAQSQLGLRLKNSGFKRLRRSTRGVATFCERLAWIPHSRRRSYPMTRLPPLPFQPRPRIRRRFQVRLLLELQPMIFLSSVPHGGAFYCSLTPRLSQSAKRVGCPLACNTDRLPIPEICQGVLIFRESSGLPI